MESKQLNTSQFKEIYPKLGIDINKLGCVMLDIEQEPFENLFEENELHYAKDKKKFWWINGFVAGKTPHITLLYGLLKSGKAYEKYIKRVLKDWKLKTVTVEEVSFFDTTFASEPYYCIIAKVKVTDVLLEGHERLQFLPHIDTFTGYKPHITIAYIKKDDKIKKRAIRDYTELLEGKKLKITGLNLGGKKS